MRQPSSFRSFEEFAAHYRAKDDQDTRHQSANTASRLCDEGATPEDAYEQAEAFAEGAMRFASNS